MLNNVLSGTQECQEGVSLFFLGEAESPISAAEEVTEHMKRYLLQGINRMAIECIYLTNDEVKGYLKWDELVVAAEPKQQQFQLCREFREMFASTGNTSCLETVQHSIDTGLADPIKSKPRRHSLEKRAFVRNAMKKMMDKGVIEHSVSSWSSPIVLVEKKDGDYRFCTDYRRLNAVTKKDSYFLPRIDDLSEKLRGAEFFSTFDLASGYWQVPIYPPHK